MKQKYYNESGAAMYAGHAAVALFRGLFVHEKGMLSWYPCRAASALRGREWIACR